MTADSTTKLREALARQQWEFVHPPATELPWEQARTRDDLRSMVAVYYERADAVLATLAEHRDDVLDVLGMPKREGVLAEVAVERLNQDRKWGEQNHPNRMTMYRTAVSRMAYGIESAQWFQTKLAAANERGECSWDRILLEEVAEAMDECARGDIVLLRAELMQVAAVAVAWVEAIDRRPKEQPHG